VPLVHTTFGGSFGLSNWDMMERVQQFLSASSAAAFCVANRPPPERAANPSLHVVREKLEYTL